MLPESTGVKPGRVYPIVGSFFILSVIAMPHRARSVGMIIDPARKITANSGNTSLVYILSGLLSHTLFSIVDMSVPFCVFTAMVF